MNPDQLQTSAQPLDGRSTTAPAWLEDGLPERPAAETAEEAERRLRVAIAGDIAAQRQPCPDHPNPRLPRPSCWVCGRNGMVVRAVRIALGTFAGQAAPNLRRDGADRSREDLR